MQELRGDAVRAYRRDARDVALARVTSSARGPSSLPGLTSWMRQSAPQLRAETVGDRVPSAEDSSTDESAGQHATNQVVSAASMRAATTLQRMTNTRFFVAALALITAPALGCSADAADETDKGSPPKLVDVTFDKNEIPVGALETVKVTITYSDADGDVAKIGEQLTTPSGTSQSPNVVELSEAAGQKEGTHAFALQIAAPAAGAAEVSFWLVDRKGNESDKVTRTITAK